MIVLLSVKQSDPESDFTRACGVFSDRGAISGVNDDDYDPEKRGLNHVVLLLKIQRSFLLGRTQVF